MLRIGLTGGIACGKSMVSSEFSALHVPVIDADIIARQLVEPGQPALDEIIQAFGRGFITPSDQLDREKLREHIFTHPDARKQLEAILHPRIASRMQSECDRLDAPYCILVIPLLVEAGQQHLVDRILVVDCPPSVQRDRLRQRDGVPPDQISAILESQLDRETRLSAADDVLSNDVSPEQLRRQVRQLHERYLSMSQSPDSDS